MQAMHRAYAIKELNRTGLFHLVTDVNKQLAKRGEECKFCFAVKDSKAEKLSASGAPESRWGAPLLNHSYRGYA